MRYFNLIGNKFFSWLLTWILGQPIKDTLCGTKVLWRADYNRIVDNRRNVGEEDPSGDFDLLLGAAKLNLKMLICLFATEKDHMEKQILVDGAMAFYFSKWPCSPSGS